MLAIKIDDIELENRFKEYAKKHKKSIECVIYDALKMFLDTEKKTKELFYTKKDYTKHLYKIEYEDDNEDLSDVRPYSHIDNAAEYVHNLRRMKNR